MIQKTNKYFFVSLIIFFASCTATRFIPKDEKLYTGAEIKLLSPEKIKDKKYIIKNAEQAVRPKPNKTFLGMRPKLWFYSAAGDSTKAKKGIRKWIKNKLGEPRAFLGK